MAKQDGIVRFVGTLGGINFYNRKGVAVARKAGGGFTSKAIKNKASMQRVRENSSEFGKCSTVKKNFRLSLIPFLNAISDGSLHGRMMRLFQEIKTLDTINTRGNRTVGQGMTTAMGKKLLREFNFTPLCNISETMGGNSQFNWNKYEYVIEDFNIKDVTFPKGASHVGLHLGVLCFDFFTLNSTLYESDLLLINQEYNLNTIQLSLNEIPNNLGTTMAVLGMQFYQEVENEFYAFKDQSTVGINVLAVR